MYVCYYICKCIFYNIQVFCYNTQVCYYILYIITHLLYTVILQLDNQLVGAVYPVVFSPTPLPKSVAAESGTSQSTNIISVDHSLYIYLAVII